MIALDGGLCMCVMRGRNFGAICRYDGLCCGIVFCFLFFHFHFLSSLLCFGLSSVLPYCIVHTHSVPSTFFCFVWDC